MVKSILCDVTNTNDSLVTIRAALYFVLQRQVCYYVLKSGHTEVNASVNNLEYFVMKLFSFVIHLHWFYLEQNVQMECEVL